MPSEPVVEIEDVQEGKSEANQEQPSEPQPKYKSIVDKEMEDFIINMPGDNGEIADWIKHE